MKKLLLFPLAAFSAALLAVPPTGPLPTLKRPPRKVVIEAEKKAALAKTVLGTKETLLLIRASRGKMLATTLYFASEIKKE